MGAVFAWLAGLGVRFWMGAAISCALTATVLGGIHKASNAILTHRLKAECRTAQKLTDEVSHGLQKELAALDIRLSNARRLHGDKCISFTPPRYDATPKGAVSRKVPAGNATVNAGKIIDLMGEADREVAKLRACQKYVKAKR
jgi:hypothetical protein